MLYKFILYVYYIYLIVKQAIVLSDISYIFKFN